MPNGNPSTSTKPSQDAGKGKNDANNQNEGEGSTSAARRYNEGVAKTVKSGKVDELAKKAEKAIDGGEKEDLDRAVEAGKKGQHS